MDRNRRQARGQQQSRHDAGDREFEPLAHDQGQDFFPVRSQRHPDSDLVRALGNQVGHDAIDAHARQSESQRREQADSSMRTRRGERDAETTSSMVRMP